MRNRAMLWLLALLLYGFSFPTSVIMGAVNGEDSLKNLRNALNHRLADFETAFLVLAIICGFILVVRPKSRVLWACSIGLMAGAALTHLLGVIHLSRP